MGNHCRQLQAERSVEGREEWAGSKERDGSEAEAKERRGEDEKEIDKSTVGLNGRKGSKGKHRRKQRGEEGREKQREKRRIVAKK